MSFEIDSGLFPIPESQYAKEGPLPTKWALSILAFHLHLVMSPGNKLTGGLKGDYFFGDSEVPLPRPATVLAWNKLVRVGQTDSKFFIPPFLPSLRDEDEVGQAISRRGSHLVSLSRRSSIQHRDSKNRIRWGSIYTGMAERNATQDTILLGQTNRSNIVEAMVCPREWQHPASSQESIRSRYESLAVYGVLSTKALVFLPPIHRLLFRFLSHESVAEWALAYNKAYWQVMDDPDSVDADYQELIHWYTEESKSRNREEIDKAVKNVSRFSSIDDINF